jgi:ketosteroid isomerase-like protein
MKTLLCGIVAATFAVAGLAQASTEQDRRAVAALDLEFQAAVKRNDAATIERILHDEMILVLGDGRTFTRAEIIDSARTNDLTYEQQDEDAGTQTVRIWGDTAVVTARLWVRGAKKDGTQFDRHLWFSDTYVRTPQGWKYAFGQASLKLPDLSPL